MGCLGGPGNLLDAKTDELCREQLFQYLSLYVMFFIARVVVVVVEGWGPNRGVITYHIFRFLILFPITGKS